MVGRSTSESTKTLKGTGVMESESVISWSVLSSSTFGSDGIGGISDSSGLRGDDQNFIANLEILEYFPEPRQ